MVAFMWRLRARQAAQLFCFVALAASSFGQQSDDLNPVPKIRKSSSFEILSAKKEPITFIKVLLPDCGQSNQKRRDEHQRNRRKVGESIPVMTPPTRDPCFTTTKKTPLIVPTSTLKHGSGGISVTLAFTTVEGSAVPPIASSTTEAYSLTTSNTDDIKETSSEQPTERNATAETYNSTLASTDITGTNQSTPLTALPPAISTKSATLAEQPPGYSIWTYAACFLVVLLIAWLCTVYGVSIFRNFRNFSPQRPSYQETAARGISVTGLNFQYCHEKDNFV